MSLKPKLRAMVETALAAGSTLGLKNIRRIGATVSMLLTDANWAEPTQARSKELEEALLETKRSARLFDAAICVNERVLTSSNGAVLDIGLTRDLRRAQRDIYDAFEGGKAPPRGFVYVAWRKAPERYFYVGKAGSVDRLNLSAHGKLSRATADATLLSLVFPAQSREEILLDVEASIIELVDSVFGEAPELNDRIEPVPWSTAQKELDQLARFLEGIGKRLRE